jgi:hypothetical protein
MSAVASGSICDIVIPAKGGIHFSRILLMDSRFR